MVRLGVDVVRKGNTNTIRNGVLPCVSTDKHTSGFVPWSVGGKVEWEGGGVQERVRGKGVVTGEQKTKGCCDSYRKKETKEYRGEDTKQSLTVQPP